MDSAPKLSQFVDPEQNKAYEEVISLLKEMCPGLEIKRDEKLVRGLDYYNGTCFEIKLGSGQPNPALKNMQTDLFGQSQNTILAGGRYDYLASQFGYSKAESLSSIGWAAGMNRLVMILDYMQKNQAMGIPKYRPLEAIGIISHMDKSERQYGPEIRNTCFKISQSLKLMSEDVQIQMDLRDNLKLKDKLSFVMNNQNTFLKERATKTIVVGVNEL